MATSRADKVHAQVLETMGSDRRKGLHGGEWQHRRLLVFILEEHGVGEGDGGCRLA